MHTSGTNELNYLNYFVYFYDVTYAFIRNQNSVNPPYNHLLIILLEELTIETLAEIFYIEGKLHPILPNMQGILPKFRF